MYMFVMTPLFIDTATHQTQIKAGIEPTPSQKTFSVRRQKYAHFQIDPDVKVFYK